MYRISREDRIFGETFSFDFSVTWYLERNEVIYVKKKRKLEKEKKEI